MTTLTTAHGCTALHAPGERTRTAPATHVTPQGAAWLASASAHPRRTLALWEARPGLPATLPCGNAFDVVNVPLVLGRRVLDLLWAEGPGSGPVAVHRGRMLLFAAPGTAHRLPALLAWEEWGPPAAPRRPCATAAATPSPCRRWPPSPARRGGSWPPMPGSPGSPGPRPCSGPSYGRPAPPQRRDLGISIFRSADPPANVFLVSKRR